MQGLAGKAGDPRLRDALAIFVWPTYQARIPQPAGQGQPSSALHEIGCQYCTKSVPGVRKLLWNISCL